MTKTESRRRKVAMPFDIRKKFAAAICMLLIASIMMVSSSYAWFTLSTAPEVTGITTSVGANGNLEIVLLNWDSFTSTAPDLGVKSDVGDSMVIQNKTLANITWGNLVDLDDATYGLDNIILNPAALNITDVATDGKTIGSMILKAPSYGSDGRILAVNTNTVTGEAAGNSFTVSDEHAGVRAIGVSSGVTLRQSSYRNAVNAITSNMTKAKNAAIQSLVSNGGNLGGLLMKVSSAENPGSVTFTREEVEYFDPMLASLELANGYVLDAVKSAALAYALSSANNTDLSDEQVGALVTAINNAEATETALATAAGVTLPAEINNALAQYNTTNDEISEARDIYDGLANKEEYTYTEVKPILDALINKTYVQVGDTLNPGRDDIGALAAAAYEDPNTPVAIEMKPGSGVYSDIATSVGQYTAGPILVPVKYGMLSVNLRVNMTATGDVPSCISEVITAIQATSAYGGGTGATSIEDTYGYAIDFGFRTNAANANLLLQQGGIQRIYSGENASTNEQTLGGGSYIEFTTSNATTFSVDDVKALMSAIRIVFTVPATGDADVTYKIVAVAAPDIATSQTEGNTVKAKLALYGYTAAIATGTTDEVIVTLGEKKTTGEGESVADDLVITSLTQNVATKLTAIVYLDGDAVDNTMVANAQTSMTGSLNLQFATDAELVPMENAALRDGTNGG